MLEGKESGQEETKSEQDTLPSTFRSSIPFHSPSKKEENYPSVLPADGQTIRLSSSFPT